jgi:hypothetical protein
MADVQGTLRPYKEKNEPKDVAAGYFCDALKRKATFFIRLNVNVLLFTKYYRNNLPSF